mgnify:CR=1 FL=1
MSKNKFLEYKSNIISGMLWWFFLWLCTSLWEKLTEKLISKWSPIRIWSRAEVWISFILFVVIIIWIIKIKPAK